MATTTTTTNANLKGALELELEYCRKKQAEAMVMVNVYNEEIAYCDQKLEEIRVEFALSDPGYYKNRRRYYRDVTKRSETRLQPYLREVEGYEHRITTILEPAVQYLQMNPAPAALPSFILEQQRLFDEFERDMLSEGVAVFFS